MRGVAWAAAGFEDELWEHHRLHSEGQTIGIQDEARLFLQEDDGHLRGYDSEDSRGRIEP